MVVGAYYPELAGGSLQCRTLVTALRGQADIAVLATSADAGLPEQDDVDGIAVTRVHLDAAQAGRKWLAAHRLVRAARRVFAGRDIVHFHGITEKVLPLLTLAKLTGRRTLGKLTSVGWDDPVALRQRRFGTLLATAVNRLDLVVAISPAMRDRCRAAGMADERIALIPNGVDTAVFAPADAGERRALRDRLGLPPDGLIVIFVGFWSLEKGPHLLFDAWQQARAETDVPFSLVYLGRSDAAHPEVDSVMVARVKAAAERLAPDRVRFVERTTEVAAFLKAADIFALPSAREGLPNALLEAMSCGLPCVAGDLPGVTDFPVASGVNGVLVPPRDAVALGTALADLARDAARRQAMGAAARGTVLREFAITQVAADYLRLYRDLLGAA
jgi:glycosyltransferase involved in cell wall biosynthesis